MQSRLRKFPIKCGHMHHLWMSVVDKSPILGLRLALVRLGSAELVGLETESGLALVLGMMFAADMTYKFLCVCVCEHVTSGQSNLT